jgi:hypothetical protein
VSDEREDEWAHREVCADGACVGVIGPDGTCKVCGRAAPNWGDERKRGMVDEPDAEPDDDDDDDDDDGVDAADDAYDEDDDDEKAPGWDKRELCSNGACTGVIGDDGKCKVCGKAA